MSPYGEVWAFTRERLAQCYQDLSHEQLVWRPHHGAHNIGEMLYHLAGCEVWFAQGLGDLDLGAEMSHLKQAARDSYITEDDAPFKDDDMTVEKIDAALAASENLIRPIIESPTEAQLAKPTETVIGPVVPGVACLWRVAQHSAYHTGQVWTYRFDPRFPK